MAELVRKLDGASLPGPPTSKLTPAQLIPRELPVRQVSDADSPRLRGLDMDHVRLLTEIATDLPPIVVHEESQRVIDGAHRLEAARLRGDTTIRALVFQGTEQAAFVLAVEANVSHGLPLSLTDRREAAARIFKAYPQWSDRRLASVCGLSASTIAQLRQRLQGEVDSSESRVGKDGKIRPIDGGTRRLKASELFKSNPKASLRQVAAEAGVSLGTARDVKERLRHGVHPVPRPIRSTLAGEDAAWDGVDGELTNSEESDRSPVIDPCERGRLLETLRNDPSVRFTDSGRRLLQWLTGRRASGVDGWDEALSELEPHCDFVLAKLARSVSEEWATLATVVEKRSQDNRD
jgi:ParB-like chromosome segregation protein Spo0J